MEHYQNPANVRAPERILMVSVVTPEATLVQTPAQFVALPLFDGELGVLPGHSPFIGRLGYGELRVEEGNNTRRFYIDGGFVQVADNAVSVLTNSAIPADKLDTATARDELAAAQSRKANTPELLEIRDRALLQARAKVRIAERRSAR
jgi:F-type H+-transporting ATPase subunit epsilon